MATKTGTVIGVQVLTSRAGTGRKMFEVYANFPAYTTGTDTANLPAIGASIASFLRSGKTYTLVDAVAGLPGTDGTAPANEFIGAPTVSGADLTFSLVNSAGTGTTFSASTRPSQIFVVCDES